jgi:DNA-binding CsgD family transcriptional regulator
LTLREKEVLVLMLKDCSDQDISDKLRISIYTVKDYGKSIRKKYQVKSRLQLISSLLARNWQASHHSNADPEETGTVS